MFASAHQLSCNRKLNFNWPDIETNKDFRGFSAAAAAAASLARIRLHDVNAPRSHPKYDGWDLLSSSEVDDQTQKKPKTHFAPQFSPLRLKPSPTSPPHHHLPLSGRGCTCTYVWQTKRFATPPPPSPEAILAVKWSGWTLKPLQEPAVVRSARLPGCQGCGITLHLRTQRVQFKGDDMKKSLAGGRAPTRGPSAGLIRPL